MMKKLSNVKWNRFKAFGQEKPFQIATTNSSIDSIRLIDEEDKRIPYITRSDTNNGIAKFVGSQNMSFGFDCGGCITIGLDTQTAFWQPHDFVTGQNVQVITGCDLSKDVAQFIIPLLKGQMRAKFNWGGNGATLGRMKALELMLPVAASGQPDYKYMTKYVQIKREELLKKYKAYVEKRISELGSYVDIMKLEEKEWQSYSILELFHILPGKRLVAADTTPGTRPFIGALDNSNGVARFVSNTNVSLDRNVLGVNYNGNGMVIGFYHPYECIFSDDVKRFHLRDHEDNAYVLLFMKTVILQQKSKFGYLYKFNADRMANTKIMLPIDDDGKPDYMYMEQYAKNMMLRKYKQYLSYLDSKES